MSTTDSPELILAGAQPALSALADEQAARDASDFLWPGIAGLTPGDLAIGAKGRVVLADLQTSQRMQLRDLSTTRARDQDTLDAHERGEEVTVSASAPRPRVIAVEFVVMAIVGIIETTALTGPIGTILDLPMTSTGRYLIPAIVAITAAILAHQYGVHGLAATRSKAPRVEDAERAAARRCAVAVIGVGAVAVIARVYAAELESQLAGGNTIAPEGLAFFVAFQLAFALGSLALAHSYYARVGAALDERMSGWIDGLGASVPDLDAKIKTAGERYSDQRQQVAETIGQAWLRYRIGLAEQHPDGAAKVIWTNRTAEEFADGSVLHRLCPDLFPASGPGPGDGPPPDDGPDPTHGPPAGDGPKPTDGPTPRGASTSAPTDTPRSADDAQDEQDLFDAILNPPTPR